MEKTELVKKLAYEGPVVTVIPFEGQDIITSSLLSDLETEIIPFNPNQQ